MGGRDSSRSVVDETRQAESVAEQVLADESAKRRHVVVYLSGAHAYGFPSPDSDLDMKAIHISDTDALLGLHPPAPTYDRAEILDGVEIDYTSNELGAALIETLQGNGNFIERVLGDCTMQTSDLHDGLRSVVQKSLSRRVHRHYRGFATSQLKALDASPTVKKTLYVLRTPLTGAHLLRTGHVVADVTGAARRLRVWRCPRTCRSETSGGAHGARRGHA